jgi:hypothetical protein
LRSNRRALEERAGFVSCAPMSVLRWVRRADARLREHRSEASPGLGRDDFVIALLTRCLSMISAQRISQGKTGTPAIGSRGEGHAFPDHASSAVTIRDTRRFDP